jgi:hypothetical protein
MSDSEVPRRTDRRHGEHVEEDRPVVEQPEDESDPENSAEPKADPTNAPARPLRPG